MNTPAKKVSLTKRQREVITLAAKGYGDKAIAAALKITTHAVNMHFRLLYRKTGLSTRPSLCARFDIHDPAQLSLTL
jgi:DNA-binding CsgD family transcriptional regulator